MFPAVYLAAHRSTRLVDYVVYVFVFNRGIRRVVDYYFNESFNPLSPISLTPLVTTLLMFVVVLMSYSRLPKWAKMFLAFYGVAVFYAFGVGFIRVSYSAVYSLTEVLAPVSLFGYAVSLNPTQETRDRWIRSFSWSAILVSAYGWYQYVTIPPWDAFWLIESKMIGYMGVPEPYKMSVFSTMAERGILAGYLGYSIVPMIISHRWRTACSWFGVLLVLSCILLTMSRGGILVVIIGTGFYFVINGGAKGKELVFIGVLLALFASTAMSLIPNSERIVNRFETLGNFTEDGSFKGRMINMSEGIGEFTHNPIGFGLGAGGVAGRVNSGNMEVEESFGDAGYFDIILTFGLVGTCCLASAMYILWRRLSIAYVDLRTRNEYVMLARAFFVSLFVTCFAGNFLTGFSVLWLAWATSLASLPTQKVVKSRHIVPRSPGDQLQVPGNSMTST